MSYHPRHAPFLTARSLPRWALIAAPVAVIGLLVSLAAIKAGAGSAPGRLHAGLAKLRYYCVADGSVSAGQPRGWLERRAAPHACPAGYQLTPVRRAAPVPAAASTPAPSPSAAATARKTPAAPPSRSTAGKAPAAPPSPTASAASTPAASQPAVGTTAGQNWVIAPAGTSLPRSDAYCSARVAHSPERVAANTTANHAVPPAGTSFHWGPFTRSTSGLAANFAKVTGNFSGSTDEILEWAACKWGWNANFAKAEAVRESSWHQSMVGDSGHSFGILQVRASRGSSAGTANDAWGGWPWTARSTAVNADAQMAYLRACYDGKLHFGNGYHAGDAWGCIGSWFSGGWRDAAARGYISRVQSVLSSRGWLAMH